MSLVWEHGRIWEDLKGKERKSSREAAGRATGKGKKRETGNVKGEK